MWPTILMWMRETRLYESPSDSAIQYRIISNTVFHRLISSSLKTSNMGCEKIYSHLVREIKRDSIGAMRIASYFYFRIFFSHEMWWPENKFHLKPIHRLDNVIITYSHPNIQPIHRCSFPTMFDICYIYLIQKYFYKKRTKFWWIGFTSVYMLHKYCYLYKTIFTFIKISRLLLS